jgi:hypothetical protein
MFLIYCKLYEHGSHTTIRDDVYILYFVILMEKISVSFEIHMRKFCMDIGHSHTVYSKMFLSGLHKSRVQVCLHGLDMNNFTFLTKGVSIKSRRDILTFRPYDIDKIH